MSTERVDQAMERWYRAMEQLERITRFGSPEERAVAVRAAGDAQEAVFREMSLAIARAAQQVDNLASQMQAALEDRNDRLWRRVDEQAEAIAGLTLRVIHLEQEQEQEARP